MSLDISAKELRNRYRNQQCVACGKPQTSIELNSCNDPKCVKELRPLFRWARKVWNHLQRPQETTYIGS